MRGKYRGAAQTGLQPFPTASSAVFTIGYEGLLDSIAARAGSTISFRMSRILFFYVEPGPTGPGAHRAAARHGDEKGGP